MPRSHTEFLRSDSVPWELIPSDAPRAGCERRLLSEDPDTGACSLLMRYPPGWSVTSPLCLSSDEEVFVLDGDLATGAASLTAGDYAYWPAGYPRGPTSSVRGCTMLTFFESAPRVGEGMDYDRGELVERLPTADIAWSAPSEQSFDVKRVGRKVLKPAARDGGRTWLLRIDADEASPFEINGVERHPCVEEMFLLSGDIAMTCGTMQRGDYFWRPPNVPHGPMGTRSGFLGFFRAKEGRFATTWSEPAVPIPWDAPYRPILPESRRPR